MRRSWLSGLADVTKRYLIAAAAHNLGRILRKLFGIGKPKALQGAGGLAALVQFISWMALVALQRGERSPMAPTRRSLAFASPRLTPKAKPLISTDC